MGQDSIVLLGVNHKKTPLEIREKMALSRGYQEPLEQLRGLEGLKEYYRQIKANCLQLI